MAYRVDRPNRVMAFPVTVILGLVAVAPIAHAGTTLVGGGSYTTVIGLAGDDSHRLLSPAAGSLLYSFTAQNGNPVTSFCQADAGEEGQAILAGILNTNVQNVCIDGSAPPTGFGAASVGRTDLTQPNFVVADYPVSAFTFSSYIAHHPASKPVQFPALAASIAITFNKAGVTTLNLTDQLICGIFSGQITDWSDDRLIAAGVPAGVHGPMNVVYEQDGSGITFSFSNHLSAVCGGAPAQHFVTDSIFDNVVSLFWPGGYSALPRNWIPITGERAVIGQVAVLDGSIGYASAPDVANAFALFATVNGLDPLADLSSSLTINSSDVLYNNTITGADAHTGRPMIAPIASAPSTSCIALLKPSAYAAPSSGYPIVEITYLLGNSNANGPDAANVRKLLGAPYNQAITYVTSTIGANTGMAFLNASISQSQIDACIVN
ncbi:substrate-binding domain-containing protein [Dyella silvatica]|uniref:substrate-binding domain-containing protein n=1 Tax=Dyella silvatica TaxID=2992128 RepID=UPI002254ACBC|nr:substrate-binding domain-containing protein [Dyella silvatica]